MIFLEAHESFEWYEDFMCVALATFFFGNGSVTLVKQDHILSPKDVLVCIQLSHFIMCMMKIIEKASNAWERMAMIIWKR